MKYIEILEDIECHNLKKGDVYCINKKIIVAKWLAGEIGNEYGLISPTTAGAVVHAGKAKFLDQETVKKMAANDLAKKAKTKKKAVKAKKKDKPENADLDSDISDDGN